MAKTALRGALVGFGRVAEKAHAPALLERPELEVAAVVDEAPERLKAAAAVFPKAKAYATLEALFAAEKGLNFVVIATPPSAHGAQVLAALRAGCHVLCEKPLTLDVEQFEDIRREASERKLAAYTVHNWAHSPQWQKLFSLIREGSLGELRHVELHALRTQPAAGAGDWRTDAKISGGGVLVDHGWHNFYLLNRLVKGTPTRVTGRLGPGGKPGTIEDDATVFLEYPQATALVHLSWRSALRSNTGLFFGSKGLLELDDIRLILHRGDGSEETFEFAEKLSAASAHPDWTAGLLADFLGALGDPARASDNLEEAGFCLKMINRVYVSVRVGRNPLREALSRPRGMP
ncbi:MAG: Gfo/Idh/MocA family oxidoreductase [Elusimicrobia bacterium]|nr:Gfo/Idh/MocA family oxidoreductase [Elusimicrobiota bacterium]